MAAETGYFSVLIAFFVALYAIVTAFIGERQHHDVLVRSARNGVLVAFGMVTVAILALFLRIAG